MNMMDDEDISEKPMELMENPVSSNLNDSETVSEMLPSTPISDIIDYLVRQNSLSFKSQQIGESDLSIQEKKTIALELYNKGKCLFLNKFGPYLSEDQLSYFQISSDEDYELSAMVSYLKKILHDNKRKIIIKNRRYEALTKMIRENSYFTETEMMKRNPLLYEQLIGQYLTEKEKVERDNIDTENITLLNVLLESMDRRQTRDILEKQRISDEPDDCLIEDDSTDETSDDEPEKAEASHWGEFEKPKSVPRKRTKRKPKPKQKTEFITATERTLFHEEFVQEMYRSFLAGEDENIDYETIDSNVEFDSLDVRGRDEEEKYFDSETPEEVEMLSPDISADNENHKSVVNENSEDELDIYMKHLNNHPALKNVSQI